jgi:hypothetical protein
LGDV